MRLITHWIDGESRGESPERTGPVYDPATGAQTAEVSFAGKAEVDAAVAAARTAFSSWGDSSLTWRQNIMFAFREFVASHRLDMARALTAEHGKTVDDALGEVQRGLEVIEFACNIAHLLKGDYSEQVSRGVDTYTIRQPLGIVAGITPFNFPTMVPMWMYPIAIACGNTFVLKPSEKDPSTSQLAAEMLAEAGLPDGVFNVVHGDKEAVDAVLAHPDIAAVSFVGSTPIARYIYETGTRNGKRVQALGGAKNHMVVLPDADMDLAADSAVSAGYGSAGERCMAISVIVAVGDAADRLIPKMQERMETLKVAPGTTEGAEMGPLVTKEHRDRVAGYVDAGVEEGATLVADGRALTVDGHEDGFFIGPNLFDNVDSSMRIYQDEIFGPVLGDRQSRQLRGGHRSGQRQPVGQRHGRVHQRWRCGTQVPERDTGGDGWHQPADTRAAFVLLVRRVEGVDLREPCDLRARRRALLHQAEGRDQPLVGSRAPRCRPRVPPA